MRSIVHTLSLALKTIRTAVAVISLAAACLVVLPSTPASADTGVRTISTPVVITNGNWPDRMLCASQWDESVWLQQSNGGNPYCQWEQIGDPGKFVLYNPQKRKVMAFEGGNVGPVVMENLAYPTPNQQYFSWGGMEDWGASALQSYLDSGQNVDAKDPNSDNPRTDAVHTRGWRHGHQRELTWNAVPVSGTSLSQAAAELASYDGYLSADLGTMAPNETDCLGVSTPIRSTANGQYISAELGYSGDQYGMLRARAGGIGPWEQFNLCRNNTTNTYAIRSTADGQYVSAELGYGGDQYGMLRARAGGIGPWEQFTFEPTGNGYAIRSAANGQYISAELGYSGDQYGMLRARAGGIGPWEQFQ